MALLRKKYFSIAANGFVDVPLSQTNVFDSKDVGSGSSTQKIRILSYKADIDTHTLTEMVEDLLFNDTQVLANALLVGELMNFGVFKNVGKEFKLTRHIVSGYPDRLTVGAGRLRNAGTITEYVTDTVPVTGNISSSLPQVTSLSSTVGMVPGMLFVGAGIPDGALILSVDGPTQITLDLPATSTLTGSPFSAVTDRVFKTGVDFGAITPSSGNYRRDLIEFDVTDGLFYVRPGLVEFPSTVIPPWHTQLDVSNPNRYAMFSVLLKDYSGTTHVVEANEIWSYIGLDSSVIPIVHAEVDKDWHGFYSLHREERLHVTDDLGNPLDFEYGQSTVSANITGPSFDESSVPSLVNFDQSQVPQTYDPLNNSIISMPFQLDKIEDNYTNTTSVNVNKIKLAIKNDPRSIGNEGMAIRVQTAAPVFASPQQATSGTSFNPLTFVGTLEDILKNFTLPIGGYTITTNDFVVITSGAGVKQLARISSISSTILQLTGLTKPIDSTSKYQIFKNSTAALVGSESVLTNTQVRAMVLSGSEGKFGPGGMWRKVTVPFSTPLTLNLGQWYFIQVRGNNESPPTWNETPSILMENPTAINPARSVFFETYYTTVSGLYPSPHFLIEDELGDIGVADVTRTEDPYRRPIRYNTIARALDSDVVDYDSALNDEDCFVDVHSGRIRFKKGSEPRRVFVTYYKKDFINGDASTNNIKYTELENATKKNLTDKIDEIDNKFKKGAQFKKTVLTNGIVSAPSDSSFKGSFVQADAVRHAKNVTLNDMFDRNDVDENDVIKFSRGYSDYIDGIDDYGYVTRQSLLASSPSTVRDGVLVSSFPRSGIPNKPGLTAQDEQIHVAGSKLVVEKHIVKKTFRTGLLDPFSVDTAAQDPAILNVSASAGVDGKFNEVAFDEYGELVAMKAMMRKSLAEETYPYPFHPLSVTKIKQREVNKLLRSDLREFNGFKAKTVTEKFFQNLKPSGNGQNAGNTSFLFPYTESVNLGEHEFVNNADLGAVTIESGADITVHHERMIGNSLVVTYADPLSNPPLSQSDAGRLKIYRLAKTGSNEYSEYDSVASVIGNVIPIYFTDNTFHGSDYALVRSLVVPIDDQFFAVFYTIVVSAVPRLYVNVFDLNGVSQLSSPIEVSDNSTGLTNDSFFDAVTVDENYIGVAYKKTPTESVVKTVIINKNDWSLTSTSSEVIFSVDNIYEQMKVSKFSRGKWIVGYSSSGYLRLSMFDVSLAIQLIAGNSYIEVSNSVISNGFFYDIAELSNNSLAVVYTESSGANAVTKITMFDEWYNTLSTPQTILTSTLASRPSRFSVDAVNDDIFNVSYSYLGLHRARAFQNDGQELRFAYTDSVATNTLQNCVPCTGNSVAFVYNDNLTALKFKIAELRPDFGAYTRLPGTAFTASASHQMQGADMTMVTQDIAAVSYTDNGNNVWLVLVDVSNDKQYKFVSGFTTPYQVFSGVVDAHTSIQTVHSVGGTRIIAIAFQEAAQASVVFVDVSNPTSISKSTVPLAVTDTTTASGIRILMKSNQRMFAVFNAQAAGAGYVREINIFSVYSPSTNLDGASVVGAAFAFEGATNAFYPYPAVVRSTSGSVDRLAVVYDKGGTEGWVALIDTSSSNPGTYSGPYLVRFSTVAIQQKPKAVDVNKTLAVVYRTATSGRLSLVDVTNPLVPSILAGFSNPYTFKSSAIGEPDIIALDGATSQIAVGYLFTGSARQKILDWTSPSSVQEPGGENSVKTPVTDSRQFKIVERQTLLLDFIGGLHLNAAECAPLRMQTDILTRHSSTSTSTNIVAYASNVLKVNGMTSDNTVIPPFEIFRSRLDNIPANNISGGMFTSNIHSSSLQIVPTARDKFAAFWYAFDFSGNSKIFWRRFSVFAGRVFADSDAVMLFDFSSAPPARTYLNALKQGSRGFFIAYVDPIFGYANKRLMNPSGAFYADETPIDWNNVGPQPPAEKVAILAAGILENGEKILWAHDYVNDLHYHVIYDNDGFTKVHNGSQFSLPLDFVNGRISPIRTDSTGLFSLQYVDGSDNLRYYQVGVDGELTSTLQVIGENRLDPTRMNREAIHDFEPTTLRQVNRSLEPITPFTVELADGEDTGVLLANDDSRFDIWLVNDPHVRFEVFHRNGTTPRVVFYAGDPVTNVANTVLSHNAYFDAVDGVLKLQNKTGVNQKYSITKRTT